MCLSWLAGAAAGQAATVVAGRETVSVVPDASDGDGRHVPLPHRAHPGAVPHTCMYLHSPGAVPLTTPVCIYVVQEPFLSPPPYVSI